MCDCASCTHTDTAQAWPMGGEAKGPAKARAEYSAHVSHGRRWGHWFNPATEQFEKRVRAVPDFTIRPEPVYPCTGTPGCEPVAPMPAWWYAWNERTAKTLPVDITPAPSATLYAMPHDVDTVPATAKRWNCSVERIYQWLRAGRIEGAQKLGRDWLIPRTTERPTAAKPYGLQQKKEAA